MYCQNCGSINDDNAKFCVNCGSKIIKKIGRNPAAVKKKIKIQNKGKNTKALLILLVIIIAGVGIASGIILNKSMSNPLDYSNIPPTPYLTTAYYPDSPETEVASDKLSSQINETFTIIGVGITTSILLNQSIDNQTSKKPTNTNKSKKIETNESSPQLTQTYNENGIYFNFPSNWNILNSENSNQIVKVGIAGNPTFRVDKYSQNSYNNLSNYVNESKKEIRNSGYELLSENRQSVNGLPAYELIFQGKSSNGETEKQMYLLIEDKKNQYFAIVIVDLADSFTQTRSTFDQIIKTFKFT
jgi:hypothetical protein